jgi:hypothetical protein
MDTGVADFKKCHAGEKEDCCAYLVFNVEGVFCARGTGLAAMIMQRVGRPGWKAKRLPVKPYPACHDEGLKRGSKN